jgi:hypothetical protein
MYPSGLLRCFTAGLRGKLLLRLAQSLLVLDRIGVSVRMSTRDITGSLLQSFDSILAHFADFATFAESMYADEECHSEALRNLALLHGPTGLLSIVDAEAGIGKTLLLSDSTVANAGKLTLSASSGAATAKS